MKQTLRRLAAAAAGLTAAVIVSSCAYDPYYSDGYGYSGGGSYGGSYSTSVFISTGDPRWGYDPYCHSYYDYNRRAYYDPFLYGYYPVGFRPPVVYGVPHPHGWRPGSGYCPPPSRIRSSTLSGYQNRESLYRRSNFSWSNEVRQRDSGSRFQPGADYGRPRGGGPDRSRAEGPGGFGSNRPVQRDFSGLDPSRGRDSRGDRSPFVRPPDRDSSNFQRPQMPDRSQFQRPERPDRSQFQRPEMPDRSNFQRPQMPDRSQFQRPQGQERPQFQRSQGQERSRESSRPSPSGFNNPVRLAPEHQAPAERPAPSFQRESRQAPPGGGGGEGPGRSRRQ